MHAIARLGALLAISTFLVGGSVAGHLLSPITSQPALAAGPTIAQTASAVHISNFAFSPPTITVMAGQTVTWTNDDHAPHTATSDTGVWNSGVLQPGASYSFTFSTPGTFTYHCMIHPFMTGTVTVLPSSAGGSGTTVSPASVAPAAGRSIAYPAGWNLVGGPAGTSLAGVSGPLYTFRAGDTAYETVPAGTQLAAGVGYWAFFSGSASETLPLNAAPPASLQLPAGQYVLIGNPSTSAVTVTGADSVLGYDPAHGYQATGVLQPGQGAWAFSHSGGVLTLQP